MINGNLDRMIRTQQGPENSTVWLVGQQLLEMLEGDAAGQELVQQDLETGGMTLKDCEARIAAKADALHREIGGKGVGIDGRTAAGIIRAYFGLSEPAARAMPATASALPDFDDLF